MIRTRSADGAIEYSFIDKRGQKVEAECLQCGQMSRLKLSHVYPSWAGDAHRSEGGFVVGAKVSGNGDVVAQDMPKHYLLCEDCEQLYGTAESYVRRLSSGNLNDLERAGVHFYQGNALTGVSSELIFRFVTSILLRSHAAVSSPHVRLLPHEVVELRRSINAGDFDIRFHFLGVNKIYSSVPKANARAGISRDVFRRNGSTKFELLIGGLYFVYFLRSASRERERDLVALQDEMRIGTVGVGPELLVPAVSITELNLFKRDYGFQGEIVAPPLSMAESCPCGWGRGTLAECCGSTWLAEELSQQST